MVRKKYTEEQIIAVFKEYEAPAKTADLCRKYGMNRRLKQIVAQQALDNLALKELLSKYF